MAASRVKKSGLRVMAPWGIATRWGAGVCLVLLAVPPISFADQEASNVPHVATDRYGRCYAKSVPAERYGSRGVTRVYQVGKSQDTLVHTFDWFSQRIHLACNVSDSKSPVGIAIVELGP